MTKTLGIFIYDNLKYETIDGFRILVIVICLVFVICNFVSVHHGKLSNMLEIYDKVLFTNLPTALYYKFSRGKLLQPHRSEGVQLRGADADFSAQSQLSAIIKPGGSIYQDN